MPQPFPIGGGYMTQEEYDEQYLYDCIQAELDKRFRKPPETQCYIHVGTPTADNSFAKTKRVRALRKGRRTFTSMVLHVTVSPMWIADVRGRDLLLPARPLLLSATPWPEAAPKGGECFDVMWLRQSRGFTVLCEHGFVFRLCGQVFYEYKPSARRLQKYLFAKLGIGGEA